MPRPALTEDQVSSFRSHATDVALDLFGRDGYDQFSLRTLAKALGCSHATPYRYFPDGKGEIFAAVRVEGFRRFGAALRHGWSQADTVEAQLRSMARAYQRFSVTDAAAFAVIFQMGQPTGGAEVDSAAADAWSVVLEAVQCAMHDGVLAGDVDAVAHTLWAGMHGVATLQLAGKLVMGVPADEVLQHMIEALIRAHRPSGATDE